MTRTRKASSLISVLTVTAMVLLPWQSASAEPDARHGIAMHGEPQYSEGFPHFDYVNPGAPKGGVLRMAVVANGFDTFNPVSYTHLTLPTKA